MSVLRAPALALAALVLAGQAAGQSGQTREALFTVLAGQGCRVAPDEVAEVFAPLGFTPDFVSRVLTELLIDGVASEDAGGVLSLPVGLCPPEAPAPSPREMLIGAFRETGCELRQAAVPGVEAALGLSTEQILAIVEPMHAVGEIAIAGDTATLAPALCEGG